MLADRFELAAKIAEGGFGVVYRGIHRALEKPVAIKILKTPASLPASSHLEFLEKFVSEARIIARLEHPGIVRVLDFGAGPVDGGESAPWIVLEWIDGETLEASLDARQNAGGRSPQEALALLRPIFDALAVAHDEGIAHRDLKPANIMLAKTRDGIVPKLLDFGIAKVMEAGASPSAGETATQSGLRAFTLAYAAPEQLGGTRTGPWTDVHALALVLVETLTDKAPIDGADSTELTVAALSPVRPTPAKFGLDVGPWEAVIARALSLRPSERFQHAREFLRALEAELPAVARWRSSDDTVVDPDPAAITVPRAAPRLETAVTTLRPVQASSVAPAPQTSAPPKGRSTLVRFLAAAAVGGALLAGAWSLRPVRPPPATLPVFTASTVPATAPTNRPVATPVVAMPAPPLDDARRPPDAGGPPSPRVNPVRPPVLRVLRRPAAPVPPSFHERVPVE